MRYGIECKRRRACSTRRSPCCDALERAPCSLGELVEATGYSRATAHRLAVALEDHGLVRRDDDGRFALGVRLVALGRAAAEGLPLAAAAQPALRALRDATGESVQLYVREGDRRVCVAALESPHGLRTIVAMGASLPLDVGSAGRVLSAAPGATGWVESVGEREAGVASVSARCVGPDGRPWRRSACRARSSAPSRRPGRRYGDAVVAAARQIEQAAGLVLRGPAPA